MMIPSITTVAITRRTATPSRLPSVKTTVMLPEGDATPVGLQAWKKVSTIGQHSFTIKDDSDRLYIYSTQCHAYYIVYNYKNDNDSE